MADLSDKVLNAVRYARQFKQEDPKFEVSQGTTIFLTFNGQKLFEIDSIAEANSFAVLFNASLAPGLQSLKTHLENKVKTIINA